jgi:hypothetical protein
MILAWGYLALCGAAVAYMLAQWTWNAANSELSGVALVVLGLPWTLLLPATIGTISSSAWLAILVVVSGCAVNAWLLSRVGSVH